MTATVQPDAAGRADTSRDCPFVGLLAYSEEDEEWFFGRETDARLIADNLTAYELTVLYGPSGVGKSSVISAGVLPELRRQAEREQLIGRTSSVTVIHRDWQSAAIVGLTVSIRKAITDQLGVLPAPATDDMALADQLRTWSTSLGTKIYVVLDQFEEYLLYHSSPDDPATFELADAIAAVDDGTNFLISIREDAVARLDRFDGLVPGLFDNTYRVEPLDVASARRAITGPVGRYNELHPDEPVEVEDELIDEVLDKLRVSDPIGGVDPSGHTDAVETAELQLVFERLWEHELGAGSRRLRLSTLAALGGAEDVIRGHLAESLGRLGHGEQKLAANAFTQLVTPSGSKIAHSVDDLASYADVTRAEMLALLERLATREFRVLRPVSGAPDRPDDSRFEIYHDVLGRPIAAWTAQVQSAEELEAARSVARKERRRRIAATALAVVLLGLGAFTALLLARSARQERRNESAALAAEALNAVDVDPAAATAGALEAVDKARTPQAEQVLRTALAELDERVVYSGHTALVRTGAVSPDGDRVVSASDDGTVRLWDAESGRLLHTWRGHVGPVLAAEFIDGGRQVISAGEDRTIRRWNVASGEPGDVLETGLDALFGIAVTSDGSSVAAFGTPGVEVWDWRQERVTARLDHGAAGAVSTATFADHGGTTILVTGDNVGTVRVWDVADPSRPRARWSDLLWINKVDVISGGDLIVIGSGYRRPFIWDWDRAGARRGKGFEKLAQLDVTHARPYGADLLAVSPDGERVVVGGDRFAAVFTTDAIETALDGGESFVFFPMILRGHTGLISDVTWSADGRLLATADQDGRARVWDAATGGLLNELSGHRGQVVDVAFRPDGTLLTTSDDRTARLWDTSEAVVYRGHQSWVNDLALHEQSATLVTAGADGVITGFDAGSGDSRWTIAEANDEGLGFLTAVAISDDGKYVAGAGTSGIVNVWRIDGGEPEFEAAHRAPFAITDVSFDPADERIAVGLSSGPTRLWSFSDPEAPIQALVGARYGATSDFNPDGDVLVTGGGDGSVRLWNARSGALLDEFEGHDGGVGAVRFTADGTEIVSGGRDRTVRVTEIETGESRVLRGHEHPVTAVEVDQANGRIVSGDAGGFVAVWDSTSGDLLSMRQEHEVYVNGLAVSGDGERTFSAGDDNVARSYPCITCLRLDDLIESAERRLASLPEAAGAESILTLGEDVAPGTCSDAPEVSEFTRIEPVDCSEQHDVEYFASFEFADAPDAPYPGAVLIGERGTELCRSHADNLMGELPPGVEVTSYQSVETAWAIGRRSVLCAFIGDGGAPLDAPVLVPDAEAES